MIIAAAAMRRTTNHDIFLASTGLTPPVLEGEEEPNVIVRRIEELFHVFINMLVCGRVDFSICMIKRTHSNAEENPSSGALHLGDQLTFRKLTSRTARGISQLFEVLSAVHRLLLNQKRISQRELFYILVQSFDSQQQLNDVVQDASAVLGVPRYALNIGAATRGVVAGCLRIATAGSMYHVDCEFVGSVSKRAKSTIIHH